MSMVMTWLLVFVLMPALSAIGADESPLKVEVHWGKVIRIAKTAPTVLYIGTPLTKRGAPLHDPMLKAIRELGADDVRYAPCNLYPRLSVAELEPPTPTSTSWDFSLIDPYTEDAFQAINGHPIELTLSTIPEWMFKTPKPVRYPANPEQLFYDYEQGTELRDPTYGEVAEYYARVVSWYVNGGFTDELGKWHASGHHYKVDYWGVLNEPDIEHALSPQVYAGIYDAVVKAIHKVSPQTKFVGISNSYPGGHPEIFDYFLDPHHHQPGIPLDMIAYHFYAVPGSDQPESVYPVMCFDQADRFLEIVGYIETIRRRLSPGTGTMVDEVGTMLPSDWDQGKPGYVFHPIKPAYWNLSAAVYAYVFAGLARFGVDAATESLIPGYPGQYPSIAILDWNTGQPNARYRVLKLLVDDIHPGDSIVDTAGSGNVMAQGFLSPNGSKRILIVNKRNVDYQVSIPGAKGGKMEVVDQTTGPKPAAVRTLDADTFDFGGLAVAVLTLPQ